MTIKQKNLLYGITFIIVAIGLIVGVRAWKINKIESLIEDGKLSTGLLENPISFDGEKYLVPPTDIHDAGEILPVINDPKFISISEADSFLADDVNGIDIEVNGAHRFYSYQILNWHEVVNDNFNGVNLAVTHCVLCYSSAVYETDLDFENAGLVYNNNELFTDTETKSLWSQILGTAISGKKIGEKLTEYPFNVTSWSDFKDTYPNGTALSDQTGYNYDYTSHPFGGYDTAKISYFPINNISYELANKAIIKGFFIDIKTFMVSDVIMSTTWAWNGEVANKGISVFYDTQNKITHVYLTDNNEQRLTFEFDIENNQFVDDQTKSTWSIDGFATAGELTGAQLVELTDYKQMFAMCFVGSYGNAIETLKNNSIGGSLLGSNLETEESDGTEE